MGWTFTTAYDGSGVRNYLDRQFICDNEDGKWEILKSALVRLRTYYAACRWTRKKTGEVKTFAMVVLVKYNPRDREGLTLGWKEMSEDMGPCEAQCPLAILDLLDPLSDDEKDAYARKWRESVRAFHAKRKSRPKPGDVVVFSDALHFTDGTSGRRFRCERIGHRRRAYRNLETGGLYRISRVDALEFEIEQPVPSESRAAGASKESSL